MDFSQLGNMLQQAQSLKQDMDERLAAQSFEGSAGGGAVTAAVNGKKELTRIAIAPAAAAAASGDITMLEDLIIAAVNEAGRKANEAETSYANSMLGSMGLPGM